MEDLWKQVFPVGTEDAFEEEGVLHGKKVYLFAVTEPQLLYTNGESKVTCVPVVVVVVSPFPPSDKIGISSVEGEREEIVDMKQMKMDWIPYIPYGQRGAPVERLDSQIFILSCVQRRAALEHLKVDRVKKFECCLPYFYHPFKEDETEHSTIVDIMFPSEPPVVCEFDWKMDELEEFTNELIASGELTEVQKDEFMEFVKEKVREARRAYREAKEIRARTREEMDQNAVTAFENMRFYKFYPVATRDTPNVSHVKTLFINRYYGKAHQVF